MRCPECQTDLPDTANFCNLCGKKLEVVCQGCGQANPPASRFCLECGHDLGTPATPALPKDLSFDEKLAKIQKYLPSGLAEKVLSQRDKVEGERRQVTIMFVDMKGFTPLTEKLGPEETFTLMDQVFEILIHKVHEYEGTVNELRGDGVLALFGAPVALEDGPQRAIRASLSMHREMVKFSEKVKAERGIPPIRLRIGINTGPVVVGALGNDLRVQFTAVGDTINMAARMEQLAEPGTTYVTEDTFKLTEGYFRFEALGEKEIKGKEKRLRVYRVIAPSSRRTRFDVSAERGLSRFVGRERELELLLDSFERAKAGRGQAVSIVGEAGVGKSRLLYEFRKAIANEDVTFLEGKCLSYGRGVAYHPMIDVLKSNFAIEERDGDSEIRAKVKRGLGVIRMDEDSTLPYFLELMSVKDSGIDKIQMSPEGKKDRIVGVLTRIVLKGSEIRPLIIALEDLHWMDQSSEDVCKSLLQSIPGAQVLLIFTYRPEFVHVWRGKSFHSHLNLNRLSNRESLAMVADLLGSDNIASDLQDLILEKTEGVPFFIEEFVRSLKDLRIIEREDGRYNLVADRHQTPIPSTIQEVIMARVDSLPEGPKTVLQAGSAIEREFSYELIGSVTDLPEHTLLSHLSVLKEAELLYERGIFPQSIFVFRHALTREVVYDSILSNNRRKLHEQIGLAIEELYGLNIEDHYGMLAAHFLVGHNYEKAARYAGLARKKAEKTASFNDAILYTEKRIACLERLPASDAVKKKIVDARTVLGLYFVQMGDLHKAKEAVDPIVEAATQRGDKRRLAQIYTVTGSFNSWVEEDVPTAVEHLNSGLDLAIELNDSASVALASFYLSLALVLDCRFEDAFYHLEQSLKLTMAANSLWGAANIKSNESLFRWWKGQIDLSRRTGKEAVELADQSGDTYSGILAHVSYGYSLFCHGSPEEAVHRFLEGVALGEMKSHATATTIAHFGLVEGYLQIGDYEAAKTHARKAFEVNERARSLPSLSNLVRLALVKAQLLSHQRATELERLLRYVRANRIKLYEGWSCRYLGEILLIIDDRHMSEAQHWIEEAIAADERNGMRWHLARDIAVYAELFKRKGDTFKAKEQLGKAIEIYKECGADGWMTKAEEELARMQ